MKTNKSYSKRIKVTKNGKLIARAPGKNHFNAKASGVSLLSKKTAGEIDHSQFTNKAKSRFLPGTTRQNA